MKQIIKKKLVRYITKFARLTYIRRFILFVFRLYSKEITGSQEAMLDNYGHAIRGLEKALHRHETSLNDLQDQLQRFVINTKHLKEQVEVVNSEVLSESPSTLRHSRLTANRVIKVSLVINTYNRLHTLPNTLNSLNYLRYPHLEVIVVDGPSTDGTRDYLQTVWASKIKIYTCNEANLAKSRNIGIMQAAGEVVCYIDDDAVPEADWIDELMSAYQDSKVAAVGGWTRDRTGVGFQTHYTVYNRNSICETDISDTLQTQPYNPRAEKFPGVIGVNSSFRRSALLEIGGFDEEYAYCVDDADVVLRLLDAGYEVRTIPTAEVHHCLASSQIRSQPDNFCSWSQIMTSIAYFCIKNASSTTSFRRCLEQIEERKADLRQNTRYRLATNRISHTDFERLMAEIEQFSRQGITDALAFPCRQLMKNDRTQQAQWQDFPRLQAPRQCLRLAFILKEYPPNADDNVELSIYHLAQGLAAAGHEVTVITQTEAGAQHTVSFESNLWIHRLPMCMPVTVVFPQGMPSGIPDAFHQLAGSVLTELNRINERRQIQYVIGSNWNLNLAAVIASGQYPVVLYLANQAVTAWQEKLIDYPNYATQITQTKVQALEQAHQILVCSEADYHDIELSFNIRLDEKRISLFSVDERRSAAQKLESILYDLCCQRKSCSSESDSKYAEEA